MADDPTTTERDLADAQVGSEGERADDEQPTLRQRLHAATGDRDAEAAALADQAGDVTDTEAKIAVQRARGERGVGIDEPEPDSEIATVDDAEAVAAERRP